MYRLVKGHGADTIEDDHSMICQLHPSASEQQVRAILVVEELLDFVQRVLFRSLCDPARESAIKEADRLYSWIALGVDPIRCPIRPKKASP